MSLSSQYYWHFRTIKYSINPTIIKHKGKNKEATALVINYNLLEKALCLGGGREEFERQYEEIKKNSFYIDDHRDELLQSFDGNWIAVFNSVVVANGRDYDSVAKVLAKKKMPAEVTAIRFISRK
jgi:hypothetical protein